MPMLANPSTKYRPFKPVSNPNRQWPDKVLDKPPRWLSTDLRDGNQSLPSPMNGDQKWEYYVRLVHMGYTEIEVAFPSASNTDFDFTRKVVESPLSDGVWVQALSQCRPDLIERTFQALKGAKQAIVHIYLATSECFRRVVFNNDEQETLALAVECTRLVRQLANQEEYAGTKWAFEFSPETFSDTDVDYAVRVCEAVKEAWGPTVENPIILNLPATVEMSTPNVYADQIELFCGKISEREKVCISLHPHNDRGCAVGAAELAQLAGADRVEGTIFGNGERTGNVDLVTLGLNLYTQGVHPAIDFSDLDGIVEMVERLTGIAVHARAPYAGSLVVCAFSGSHQDAIKKGFACRDAHRAKNPDDPSWEIPYLPLDPEDVGRNYDAVIRVNSQSGKGGIAYHILEQLKFNLPRGLQQAFYKVVQRSTDQSSLEISPENLVALFKQTYYLDQNECRFRLVEFECSSESKDDKRKINAQIEIDGTRKAIVGSGSGHVSAFADALSTAIHINLDVLKFTEHSIGHDKDSKAVCYVECTNHNDSSKSVWGVGVDADTTTAGLKAVLSAASSVRRDSGYSTLVGTPIMSRTQSKLELDSESAPATSGPLA